MASLIELLRPRHGTQQAERRGDRVAVQGEVEWLLTIEGQRRQDVMDALDGARRCEPLGDDLLLLDFGNAVGLFPIPGFETLEVESSKWGRQHFDRMVEELTDIASALPFAARSGAAFPYDRSIAAREDLLYHAFVYLRRVLSDDVPFDDRLLLALEAVVREPHRRFERVHRLVPLELARRADPQALVSIATGAGQLTRVGTGTSSSLRLTQALRGHLPIEIAQGEVLITHDTPENRFVKTFLQLVLGIAQGMRRIVEKRNEDTPFARRVLADCDAMERTLEPIVRHALWQDVGPMVHLPAASTVLQRRYGYREIFRHFARLQLATRVPLDTKEVWDILEAKDIARLYELWCYFKIVEAIEGILGQPRHADRPKRDDMQVTVPYDFRVQWPDGTRALYNPRFSRSGPVARRSYSVPLRPDIAVEVPGGPNQGLHLFDAKFRLVRLDAVLPDSAAEDEAESEVADEMLGIFKRGDIYKMHTYRDAIQGTRSAWALYPGTELRFFARGGIIVRHGEPLPDMVRGVGAIPLRPEGGDGQLRLSLACLLGA